MIGDVGQSNQIAFTFFAITINRNLLMQSSGMLLGYRIPLPTGDLPSTYPPTTRQKTPARDR